MQSPSQSPMAQDAADTAHRVGVIGASGFAGSEFLRLAAGHPRLEVVWATGDSQAGVAVSELYPSLGGAYGDARFATWDPDLLDEVDSVVLALPHGASQKLIGEISGRVRFVIDLAADFRLKDAALYDEWYGETHTAPELLADFVYGLPELYRGKIAGATQVAAPGCYPTAAILALEPLVRAGLVQTDKIIVDAASGVSGAGRPPKPNTTFCTVDEDFTAYGLLDHRHTPEMEAHLGSRVLFTPHLAPMSRGILVTAYATPAVDAELTTESLLAALDGAYCEEPFVSVSERPPSTKATMGSNMAHVSARYDQRTSTVIAMCALDNLVKGTAGGAIQSLNIMAGWDESLGLPRVGLSP